MKLPIFQQLLQQLIAIPSVSSVNPRWDQSNRALVEQLAEWFDLLGFDCQLLPIPNSDKLNLFAQIGHGKGGLLLSGHTDTVPYDAERWSFDPFQLTERDQRFYGLGCADMKSFFAFVLEAVCEMPLTQLQAPLRILATADEESTMAGARALLESKLDLGTYALIGEPTGLQPIRLHKGIAMEAIRVIGRSGHSSNPSLGANALEGMYQVMGELLRWRQELQQQHQNPLFRVTVPTMNFGSLQGGDNPNRICGECELQIDLRQLPGMDLADLRAELCQRSEHALTQVGIPLQLQIRSLFPGIPAMETPADALIVKVTEQLTGQTAGSIDFGTEGPFFNQLGLQTVILGAGHIDQAHQPDEYLDLAAIQPMIQLLRELIARFCF